MWSCFDAYTIYTIENPVVAGSYISLRSVESKIKTTIDYDGTSIVLNKKIELDLSIVEAQDHISLTAQQREQLKILLTEQLQREWGGFFEKYRAQSVDIFNVEEMFRRKYPHEPIDNILDKTNLNLQIEINIEGSGHYKAFQ